MDFKIVFSKPSEIFDFKAWVFWRWYGRDTKGFRLFGVEFQWEKNE